MKKYICWWSKKYSRDLKAVDAVKKREMPQRSLVIRSRKAKVILGKHLTENDPEHLEWLKAFADGFGPLAEVEVQWDEALVAKLKGMKRG